MQEGKQIILIQPKTSTAQRDLFTQHSPFQTYNSMMNSPTIQDFNKYQVRGTILPNSHFKNNISTQDNSEKMFTSGESRSNQRSENMAIKQSNYELPVQDESVLKQSSQVYQSQAANQHSFLSPSPIIGTKQSFVASMSHTTIPQTSEKTLTSNIISKNGQQLSHGRHKRNLANQSIPNLLDQNVLSILDDQSNSPFNLQDSGSQATKFVFNSNLEKKAIKRRINSLDVVESQKTDHELEIKNVSRFARERNSNTSSELQTETLIKGNNQSSTQLKSTNHKQKLSFNSDFEHFYFDPKIKIKDLNQQNEMMINKLLFDNNKTPKGILKKQNNNTNDVMNSSTLIPDMVKKVKSTEYSSVDSNQQVEDIKITPIKSDSELNYSQIEKKAEVNPVKSYLNIPTTSLNKQAFRQRAGIFVPAASPSNRNGKRKSQIRDIIPYKLKTSNKFIKLDEYEKTSYMKHASDVNRLLEFQRRNSNKCLKQMQRLLKQLYSLLGVVLSLNIFDTPNYSQISWVCHSVNQLHSQFLNLNIVSLLIFLYSISKLYDLQQRDSSIEQKIFINITAGYVTYSIHFFILIFLIAFIKFANQIKDFSLNNFQNPGFHLVFCNYKWNGRNDQLRSFAKKGILIDQIYENIDNQEGNEQWKQKCLICWAELTLLAIDNDSQLLQAIENNLSSHPFLDRLIIGAATSTLILFNSYALNLVFSLFTQVAFSFYEKAKLHLLFFNQMFIIVCYQIKIFAYLSSEFQPSFIELKISDNYEVSYINLVLIISEIAIQLIDKLLYMIVIKFQHFMMNSKIKYYQVLPLQKTFQTQDCLIINNIESELIQNQINNTQQQREGNLDEPKNKTIKQEYNKPETNNNESIDNNANKQSMNSQNKINSLKHNDPHKHNFSQFSQNLASSSSSYSQSNELSKKECDGGTDSFRVMKNSVFLICINYIILCNVILQPSVLLIGVAVNLLLKSILQHQMRMQVNQISFLDYNQLNSLLSFLSLIAIIITCFFNFVVGFHVSSINSSLQKSLIGDEFSYLFDINRVNQIIKIITLPYLLLPIIILLLALLYQSRKYQQNHEAVLRDSFYQLKQRIDKKDK